jgi:hypothetical protein
LRLLHSENDEVVVGRIGIFGRAGRDRAGHRLRIQLDRSVQASYRQPNDRTFTVDELCLLGQANEMRRVAGERSLRGKQGTIRSAKKENVEFVRHRGTPKS